LPSVISPNSADYDQLLLRLDGGPGVDVYDRMAPYLGDTFRWIDPARQPHNTKSWWHYGMAASNPSVTQRAWPAITTVAATDPRYGKWVKAEELPNPHSTALFFCKLPQTVRAGNWYTGTFYTTYGNPDYTPWPLHGLGTQTHVSRMEGSVRTYRWAELVAYCYFPTEVPVPPTGYSGLYNDTPRNYLWTGYRPKQGTQGGWFVE
jgi:hypothetical protein